MNLLMSNLQEHFEKKTNQELEYILENPENYSVEALSVAQEILKHRENNNFEIVQKPVYRPEDDSATESFSVTSYFRSFSYRDILTALSTAMLLVSISAIMDYCTYSYENNPFRIWHTFLLFALVVLLNHSLYKKEHRRSNRYLGRIIQTYMMIIFFAIIKSVSFSIIDIEIKMFPEKEDFLLILLGLLFLTFFVEIVIGLIRRFLNIIKCQIF